MSGSSGDVGSLIVDDFVVSGDEEDMTMIDEDGETFTNTLHMYLITMMMILTSVP